MQSHHLQVETDQATSTRDVASSKKPSLLMAAVGVGCFMLGVASVCLVLPSASHADSLQKAPHHDLAYMPMVMTVRPNPADARVSKHPSSFLAQQSDLGQFREQQQGHLTQWILAKSEEQTVAVEDAAKAEHWKLKAAAAKEKKDRLEAADWKLQIENYRLEVKAEKDRLEAERAAKLEQQRMEAAAAAKAEGKRLAAKNVKDRLQGAVGAQLDAKAETDRLAAAKVSAKLEQQRLEGEAALKPEKDRLSLEVAAKAIGDASADTMPAAGAVDYSAKTVVQLKDVLRNRGFKLGGNKADLVARLQKDDRWKQAYGYNPKIQDVAVTPPAKVAGDASTKNRASVSVSAPKDTEDVHTA